MSELGLGLPDRVRACLFDVDGVLTETAKVHAAAWKEMFDAYLQARADKTGEPFVALRRGGRLRHLRRRQAQGGRDAVVPPVTSHRPPRGRPRMISPGPRPSADSATRKNGIVLRKIREDGVEAYPGSVRYVRAVRAAGLRRAVVSSSANCAEVLAAARIDDLSRSASTASTVDADHLAGKPAPDAYLAAARALGVDPERAAVFEDALAGVEAGRAGGFGFVVGVDRVGQAEALRAHGADTVVTDLAELLDRP